VFAVCFIKVEQCDVGITAAVCVRERDRATDIFLNNDR